MIRHKKSLVYFPGVKMLGHFVDGLGLGPPPGTNASKPFAILPNPPAALEHLLGLMGYLRDNAPLADRRTITDAQNIALGKVRRSQDNSVTLSYVKSTKS